jgi:hypothetical protein
MHTFVALRASSLLLRAASKASRWAAIIFKFSLVPACTDLKSKALEILMLACWQSRVSIVTVSRGKGYLDAKYTAPNVCPRLLNIGRQRTDRYTD